MNLSVLLERYILTQNFVKLDSSPFRVNCHYQMKPNTHNRITPNNPNHYSYKTLLKTPMKKSEGDVDASDTVGYIGATGIAPAYQSGLKRIHLAQTYSTTKAAI